MTAAYGAIGFVVMEVADVVFPNVPLPPWTVTLVFWLILLGFPFAVGLAWIYELTPDGVRRTPDVHPDSRPRVGWSPVLAVLGLLALVGIWYVGPLRDRGGSAPPAVASELESPVEVGSEERPSVAVLPFSDLSDGDQAYFSDGVTEELLGVLARIRDLRVAGRTAAFAFRDDDRDLQQAARELGVRYLVEGSVRHDGDRVRITARLVEAGNSFTLWTETYERVLDDIFAIQSEIATAIAQSLRVPLGIAEGEALVQEATDGRAFQEYLEGRAALRQRGARVDEAIAHFDAAIAVDSSWAPAWGALAEAHAIRPLYADDGRESADSALWARTLGEAEHAAARAIALDPRDASARIALAGVFRDRWEWERAEAEIQRAIELDPDNSEAHVQYGEILWGMGRLAEAARETAIALELDRTPLTLDVHGFALYMNGHPEEAEELLREGIERDPEGHMFFLREVLGRLLLFQGRTEEALAIFGPNARGIAALRQEAEAIALGDDAPLDPEGRYNPQTWMVIGRPDRALDELERQVFDKPFRVQYNIWDPYLEPVWRTDRFRNVILPRVHLAGASVDRLPAAADG
ncbi:MAG TPA: hypothetical protein VK837_04715 [Longimicrobiales bacterium]|nr:hypothetical protein [Longimicrobiales bacterium]